MSYPTLGVPRRARWTLGAIFLGGSLLGQDPVVPPPMSYDADTTALVLARKYLEGGAGSRTAVLEALQRMGWGVRNAKGAVLQAPPAGADTGLAMRDYELEELLWKPVEQPAVRLISVAQALAVPFEDADPEELAQDLVDTVRQSAESKQPQQRFWGRFIIALGRAGPAAYDLAAPAAPNVIPPSPAQMKKLQKEAEQDPFAMLKALQPEPAWPDDDPVLAPSPRPKRPPGQSRPTATQRDQQHVEELQQELGKVSEELSQADPARQKAAHDKMAKLTTEMAAIAQRQQAASMQQMAAAMKQVEKGGEITSEDADAGPRFIAEHRDQPLSMLQIALITRVLAADLRLAATGGGKSAGYAASQMPRWFPSLPLAMISVAQAGGPPNTLGGQFSGAAGDIWATGWGAYTGKVLDHHLPENKFSKGSAIANTVMVWLKTIITFLRQNITIEVENVPLVRTKTRTAGEQRTARCKVEIDFPKSEMLKAIRAAGNLATIDLQVPDGGPVSGAKIVWRLPEGSYNTKYQTAKGGWEYKPELAVVEFAHGEGTATYTSYTNDSGEATITIEGTAQRRALPSTVRKYPRRAVIAVEVTIKVGNITQDLNDAIGLAMGGPITGSLTFLADMVLRTSFLFQKGKVFEVTDWKEPAWEGEFEITVKGSGSKHEKGEKGGPDQDYAWSMNRYMQGRLHTPDWNEEDEQGKEYANDGRHQLQVDGDSRYFRLDDSSHSHTRNSDNRYEAVGPMQIQPPGRNQLELFSRAEPSGSASLVFSGGFMTLELQPFFAADCIVGRSEQGHGRSVNKAGPEELSLLAGVSPDSFSIIEPNDGKGDYVEGTKTINGTGNLPYVPSFDAAITVKYRLWKNDPPPKNKTR